MSKCRILKVLTLLMCLLCLSACEDENTPPIQPKYSAHGYKLDIECIGSAEYYTGIVLNTMIVTPVVGPNGKGVHCTK